ncbi:hypothetical protein QBC47DRAFT_392974 [Echria macrotheca]|uniref:Uncharacterized protein n=1 Tax=Echria macrotheca TaxID=438768 RepID=A0AAJ0B520_9PEZI|nr:hypothetical protein QBC47DRAFT_392974 [Echria macrotheca]
MSPYSDASSSYWPPGWNFERFRTATKDDIDQLPTGELEKMQAGFREVLGEDGVGALSQYLFQEEQRKKAPSPRPFHPPNWLTHWRKVSRRLGKGAPWGFVIFQTAAYDFDDSRWEEYKAEIERVIALPFEQDPDEAPVPDDYHDAAAAFELRWVEDPGLAGASADVLRERYTQMKPQLPPGLAQDVFLCASTGAVNSVLQATEKPTRDSKTWREGAPFLLAVADAPDTLEEGHDEAAFFKPVFKVAAETVAEELWWLLDSGIIPLRRITRVVRGTDELGGEGQKGGDLEEIWWTTTPSPERLRKRRLGNST